MDPINSSGTAVVGTVASQVITQTSAFLSLPPEVNDKIYSNLLVEESPVHMHMLGGSIWFCVPSPIFGNYGSCTLCEEGVGGYYITSRYLRPPRSEHKTTGILKVCRQTRNEASEVMLRNNTLFFKDQMDFRHIAHRLRWNGGPLQSLSIGINGGYGCHASTLAGLRSAVDRYPSVQNLRITATVERSRAESLDRRECRNLFLLALTFRHWPLETAVVIVNATQKPHSKAYYREEDLRQNLKSLEGDAKLLLLKGTGTLQTKEAKEVYEQYKFMAAVLGHGDA